MATRLPERLNIAKRVLRTGILTSIVCVSGLLAQSPPPAVSVCHPRVRESNLFEIPGIIEPVEIVDVRSPVAGAVAKVGIQAGATVQKGELLFEIESATLTSELKIGAETVKKLTAQVKQLDESLALASKNAGGKKREELGQLTAQREVAAVTLELAEANLKRTRAELDLGRVTAPLTGRVDKPLVGIGSRVESGSRSATLLCKLARTDPVLVAFELEESLVTSLRTQLHEGKVTAKKLSDVVVHLGLPGEAGFPHAGTLDYVDNRIDPKRQRCHCRAIFPNADGALSAVLFTAPATTPEQGPRLRFALGEPRTTLLVPARAVGADEDGKPLVLIVNDKNVIEARHVKLAGILDGLQIVEQGLRAGDRVVFGSERAARDQADKTLRPEDFASDVRLLGLKPGMTVRPVLVALPGSLRASP